MKKVLGRVLLTVVGMFVLATTASASITIANKSGSVFYTDLGNGNNAVYLVFQLTGNGTSAADVWATLDTSASSIISNVGSGKHQLKYKISTGAHGTDPVAELGLANGQTKGVFFLVKASATTAVNQALTLKLSATNGGGSDLGSATFNFTVEDTIKANANKVNTVVTIPNNPSPGQLGRITVTGCTGTVGAQNVLYFSPVSADTWPADNFEFIDSDISIPGYPNTPYRDIALIPSADVAANTSDHCYDEIFSFEINGAGNGSTTPTNYVASGTQIKHTTNTSGTFQVIIPVLCESAPVSVGKSTGNQTINLGDALQTVTFTASQSGGTDFTITDPGAVLPTGVQFQQTDLTHATLSGTPSGVSATTQYCITVLAHNNNLTNPPDCEGTTSYCFTVVVPEPISAVPTVSPLGLAILALVVGGLAFHLIRTRA
jgi:hypothetical protein